MHRRAPTHFLTFVLIAFAPFASPYILFFPSAAFAATAAPSPDFREQHAEEDPNEIDPLVKDSVDMTKVPPPYPNLRTRVAEYFYRYRKAITVRGGTLYDTKATDGDHFNSLLGIQYLFPSRTLKSYEAGVDIVSDGTGIAHFARRFIYSRTRFRPYTKAGLGVRIEPADQLATFIRYENYQLRGAMGFEYLAAISNKEINMRLETEIAASFRSVQGSVTFGLVWAW